MKTEELMQPRYKVIADYPLNNHFTVGQIITGEPPHGNFFIEAKTDSIVKNITEWELEYVEKFPNIFKKLEWWEERSIEDMPKYLKRTTVKKVYGYDLDKGIFFYEPNSRLCFFSIYLFEPATEAEYNAYLTQNPKD